MDGYQTQGELYEHAPGEKENMAEFAVILREAFKKLEEAQAFAQENGFGWNFNLYIDKNENGEYNVPTNYNTDLSINITVDDQWMSSTQDC